MRSSSISDQSKKRSSTDRYYEAGLVRAARRGHRDAFDELVRRHLPAAMSVACRVIGCPDDAEDVVQDAFLKAYDGLEKFQEGSSFGTWVYRIVVNASLDHIRKRRRQRGLVKLIDLGADNSESPPEYAPERMAHQAEFSSHIDEAIAKLPTRMKTALVLRVIEGQSYETVSDVLGTTPTTCRVYVNQARKRLRQSLKAFL